jgi:hypothetical protein
LSGLLRGRRGTERKVGGHGAAEVFILLTGETVNVPEKYVPYFKTGKDLRERLNKK